MALGVTSAKCTCEFDRRNRCICAVSGEATVDTVGDYVIVRVWVVNYEQYSDKLYSKTISSSDSKTFDYNGSFNNTTPVSSSYDIRLYKSGETNVIGTERVIRPEECGETCPEPTVSIPSVSNYNPVSGEVVDFTSYAYGGTGRTIASRRWNFGDGTTSTEENPSKAWKNTTGANVDYTVTFTAINNCGKPNSTSTVITVSSEPIKNGIEIQFSDEMNGKELIAHAAIETVCGLWWTGPFAHGLLWNKGRCTWADIDSSKKYNIVVGDACQERAAIDGVWPEHPTECAGTFENNDYVIILIRNPGFDFRVYSADDIFQLTDSSFNVLYLSATSGDIVDKTFTEWICGLIGIETGSPCDMFWAEFYDPIFVANYMSIQATGKDVMGNERELGWLDHVAFVASLVGSLPVFNLFPFAGITKNLGNGIIVIARKVKDLAGDELAKAGGAMADICMNAPKVIQELIQSELDEVRAALVKVYGEVQGNKYVDDALAAARPFVKKYYDILENFRTGAADLPDDAVENILNRGQEVPDDITALIAEFEGDGTLNELCNKLMGEPSEYPLGSAFRTLSTEKSIIGDAAMPGFTNKHCKVAETATAAAEPITTMQISEGTNEIVHKASDLGFTIRSLGEDIGEATLKLADEPATSKWKLIARDIAGARFAKAMKGIKKMSRREKFMAGWFFWELMSFVVGFMLLKALGIFPGDRSFKAFQRCEAMSTAFFTCKSTCENELWDALEEALLVYETTIADAEDYLASNSGALEREHSKVTLESAIECAHVSIEIWRGCLANGGVGLDEAHGEVVFTSNLKCMAYVDDRAIGTVWESGLKVDVLPGEHTLEMKLSGYEGCTETVTITKETQHIFNCDLVEETCTKPAPAITAPLTGVVKQAVQFTGAAITESEITWWSWDFGDGDDSHDQSPSHMYWNAGTYTVKLTVTDDCGKATAEHQIIISAEGEIPDVPTPTEKSATIYVSMPTNAKTGQVLVWQNNPEIYIDGQYERKAPGSISFGGWNQPPVQSCVLMVRATGYQDLSKTFDLKDNDSLTWDPIMSPVGYTPPTPTPPAGKHTIMFYLPEGASMDTPQSTTLLKLVSGIQKIGGR